MLVMSTLLKVALGLLIGATICQLLGFACPYWVSWSYGNYGLWQHCRDGLGCSEGYGKSDSVSQYVFILINTTNLGLAADLDRDGPRTKVDKTLTSVYMKPL